MSETTIHATCIAIDGDGVLLRGAPGSGKSDLALRLIETGARLVADDQTRLRRQADRLIASAPETIAGRMEVRGLGIRRVPSLESAPVALLVDLMPATQIERLPEPESEAILEVALPRLAIDPTEASAATKLRLALGDAAAARARPAGDQRVVLVTGLSGAGRSTALHVLEDAGFEAIDNLPMRYLDSVIREETAGRPLAIGVDTRTRGFDIDPLLKELDALMAEPRLHASLLYLDCDDEILIRRFSETRRRHPLARERPVADGILIERRLLQPLKARADAVIDTSHLSSADLGGLIRGELALEADEGLSIQVLSFSYKAGLPRHADLVFDVRFLRNPHYDAGLRALTGEDPAVAAYVEEDAHFAAFFAHVTAMLEALLPRYAAEGKSYLTIALGCTGGQHRSVAVARKLHQWFTERGIAANVGHRDMPRGMGGGQSETSSALQETPESSRAGPEIGKTSVS